MKLKFLFTLIVAGLIRGSVAADTEASPVIHLDHEKVAAVFAKGGLLIQTNNFKVQAGRRDAPGGAEIHEQDTDIFYILEGSATFVTGGKATETKTTAPGEIRGKDIIGGESHQLTKGDIIIIPNGVPHWFKEVKAPFVYHVVKVSK